MEQVRPVEQEITKVEVKVEDGNGKGVSKLVRGQRQRREYGTLMGLKELANYYNKISCYSPINSLHRPQRFTASEAVRMYMDSLRPDMVVDLQGTESTKAEVQLEVERPLEKVKPHVIIDLIPKTEKDSEFRLQRFLEEPDSHKFYCPNCRACIEKVDVRKDRVECMYCYSFLVVMGNGLVSICKPRGPCSKWDILKSMVYGGLIESITSLNIVTSAAGADVSALTVLALGLANLIGGLFLIVHNLIELRNDQPERSITGETNEEEEEDSGRYYRELGVRENFKRHVAVTVISFLLFGMVAPVTYSFSFLKSGNKDLKLVAVAAASLVSITLLAIGKAYNQKAANFYAYFKIVLCFVIPGLMSSGLSYVAGDLINKLMEKTGLFDSSSSSAFTLSLPAGTGIAESRWGLY